MTRLIAIAAAALAAGCVPTDKPPGTDTPPPTAAAPAGGPRPAPEPADVGPAEPPVPLPGDDPRHVALRSYRAAVGGREEEIAAALLRLDAAAGKVASAPADRKGAVEEFRKLVPLLREAGRALLADHRAVLEATDVLAKELRHGPTAFRQAARAWRERADDYTVEAFRKNALGYADEFERYAGRLPARRRDIQGFADELREQEPFLRELVASVEDLSRFLDQHPGAGLPDPRPQYVAQLHAYAVPLTAFQGQVRKYLTALRDRGVPDAAPAPPASRPAAPPPPAEPAPGDRPPAGATGEPRALPAPQSAVTSGPAVVAYTPVACGHPVPVAGPCPWPPPVRYTPYGAAYVIRSR